MSRSILRPVRNKKGLGADGPEPLVLDISLVPD